MINSEIRVALGLCAEYVFGNNPINWIDPDGLAVFSVVKRIGEWGLKKLGGLSRDEAKRAFKKEGKEIIPYKTVAEK